MANDSIVVSADLWAAILSYCSLADMLSCRMVSRSLHAATYLDAAYAPDLAWELDTIERQQSFTHALLTRPRALRCLSVLHLHVRPTPAVGGRAEEDVCESLLAAWVEVGQVHSPPVLRVDRLSMPFNTSISRKQLLVLRHVRGLRCIGSWNTQWTGEPLYSPQGCSFQPLLQNNPALGFLYLHFVPQRPPGRIQGLVNALPTARQLVTLALHGGGTNPASIDWTPLASCTALQQLDIGVAADATTLLPALEQLSLTSLQLLDLDVTRAQLTDWAQANAPIVKTLSSLSLHIANPMASGWLVSVGCFDHLTHLSVNACEWSEADALAVSTLPSLTSLNNVPSNYVGPLEPTRSLSLLQHLQRHPGLTRRLQHLSIYADEQAADGLIACFCHVDSQLQTLGVAHDHATRLHRLQDAFNVARLGAGMPTLEFTFLGRASASAPRAFSPQKIVALQMATGMLYTAPIKVQQPEPGIPRFAQGRATNATPNESI